LGGFKVVVSNDQSLPLVSVGIPVRNGQSLLPEALSQVLAQTYTNLEIIVSNNNSSDDTEKICQHFQQLDNRVKVFNQDQTLSALENFRFVFEQATGDYFLWAAADDRRDANYIGALVEEMMKNDQASLAFSSVKKFSDYTSLHQSPTEDYEASLKSSDGFWKRIYSRSYIRSGYLHIYGLIKRSLLVDYPWPDIEIAPDRPLIFFLSCRGDFIQTDKTCFYSYKPAAKKTIKQRAKDNSASTVRRFAYSRLNYLCAKMACHAEKLEGRHRSFWLTFLVFQLAEMRNKAIRLRNRISRKFSGNRK
jgi:glycosyltransferase involved in cell wall biosynthesis